MLRSRLIGNKQEKNMKIEIEDEGWEFVKIVIPPKESSTIKEDEHVSTDNSSDLSERRE